MFFELKGREGPPGILLLLFVIVVSVHKARVASQAGRGVWGEAPHRRVSHMPHPHATRSLPLIMITTGYIKGLLVIGYNIMSTIQKK
jgi:hypothetical protein